MGKIKYYFIEHSATCMSSALDERYMRKITFCGIITGIILLIPTLIVLVFFKVFNVKF
jgi:hypothetical protein